MTHIHIVLINFLTPSPLLNAQSSACNSPHTLHHYLAQQLLEIAQRVPSRPLFPCFHTNYHQINPPHTPPTPLIIRTKTSSIGYSCHKPRLDHSTFDGLCHPHLNYALRSLALTSRLKSSQVSNLFDTPQADQADPSASCTKSSVPAVHYSPLLQLESSAHRPCTVDLPVALSSPPCASQGLNADYWKTARCFDA